MTMIGSSHPAPRGITRRAAALLILLAGPHLASATEAETLRVGKSVPQAFGFVPVDVATRNGIFRKNGLDIEITAFGGAPKLDQALAADAVDIGLNTGADMAFIVKGLPVKGVAAMGEEAKPMLVCVDVRVGDLERHRRSKQPGPRLFSWDPEIEFFVLRDVADAFRVLGSGSEGRCRSPDTINPAETVQTAGETGQDSAG
jgi:hypothetical protein